MEARSNGFRPDHPPYKPAQMISRPIFLLVEVPFDLTNSALDAFRQIYTNGLLDLFVPSRSDLDQASVDHSEAYAFRYIDTFHIAGMLAAHSPDCGPWLDNVNWLFSACKLRLDVGIDLLYVENQSVHVVPWLTYGDSVVFCSYSIWLSRANHICLAHDYNFIVVFCRHKWMC